VHEWNARKRRTLKPEQLTKAWQHLSSKGWAPAEATV
jgi:hypothetical protein